MNLLRRLDRLEREHGQAAASAAAATVVAADFVTGGEAKFARACSTKGEVIEIVRRDEDEPYSVFTERAQSLVSALGAPRLVVGGIDPAFDPEAIRGAYEAPPRGVITLMNRFGEPHGLHLGQARALRTILDNKRVVLRAGRRFGKSKSTDRACRR
jgi:hypothetical protein